MNSTHGMYGTIAVYLVDRLLWEPRGIRLGTKYPNDWLTECRGCVTGGGSGKMSTVVAAPPVVGNCRRQLHVAPLRLQCATALLAECQRESVRLVRPRILGRLRMWHWILYGVYRDLFTPGGRRRFSGGGAVGVWFVLAFDVRSWYRPEENVTVAGQLQRRSQWSDIFRHQRPSVMPEIWHTVYHIRGHLVSLPSVVRGNGNQGTCCV